MPGFPGFDILDPTAGQFRNTGLSVRLVAHDGTTYSTRMSGMGAVDILIGDRYALAEAIGAVSNMGVYELAEDRTTRINIVDAVTYDEAFSNGNSVLTIHLENNNGEKYTVDIPAPDARLFESDGVTLKPRTDATVGGVIDALLTAITVVLNASFAPANTYAFVRGVRRSRKVKLPQGSKPIPSVSEPTGNSAQPGT